MPVLCEWVGVSDDISGLDVFAGRVLTKGVVIVVGRCTPLCSTVSGTVLLIFVEGCVAAWWSVSVLRGRKGAGWGAGRVG